MSRSYTGWFVFALVFLAISGIFIVLTLLAEGELAEAGSTASDLADAFAMVGLLFFVAPMLSEAVHQIHERTGRLGWLLDEQDQQFDVRGHIVISSDDAYDYADSLPEGETIVEDKRTGECYVATQEVTAE